MKFILFFLLFATQILASNLLTYNIYERADRVDIMLSFDAPYEGNIFQNMLFFVTFDPLKTIDQTGSQTLSSLSRQSKEFTYMVDFYCNII